MLPKPKRVLFSLFLVLSINLFGQQVNTSDYKKVTKKKPILSKDSLTIRKTDTLNFVKINSDKKNDSLDKKTAIDTVDSDYLPRSASAIKDPVKYSADDSIVYSESEKIVFLFGKSKLAYQDLTDESEIIEINLEKNTIKSYGKTDSLGDLKGTPIFKQGSADYKAEEIIYNFQSKRGYLKEFKTKEGEGYIKGQRVKRDEHNNFFIRDAYYTTCEGDEPHFYIEAEKLKVIPNNKVITGPARIVFEGFRTPPIIPFGIFPLKRGQQSGIVIPSYGFSPGRGYFLNNGGYYYGGGEKFDLRLTADVWTNLSWAAKLNSRYINRYRFDGNLAFEYYKNKFGNPEDPDYSENTQFNLRWSHRMDPKARPFTNFSADVNLVTSGYYALNSMTRNTLGYTNTVTSGVSFSKSFKNGKYNLTTSIRATQNTKTRDISVAAPNLTFSVPSFQIFKPKWKSAPEKWYENITISYTGSANSTINTKDSLLINNRSSSDWSKYLDSTYRYNINHSLPINTQFKLFKYYSLTLGVNYSESWQFQTIRKEYDTVEGHRSQIKTTKVSEFGRAYSFSSQMSLATKWYGQLNFKKGKIAAIRHVLTPNVSMSFSPDFSDKMWGMYRTYTDTAGRTYKYSIFEGTGASYPGAGRNANLGFRLNNNLELKIRKKDKGDSTEKTDKIKLLESFDISGTYNFLADSLKLSPISLSAFTTLFKVLQLRVNATMDPYVNVFHSDSLNRHSITRINTLSMTQNGDFGRITQANSGINFSLNQATFKSLQKHAEERKKEMDKAGYAAFGMEWDMSIGYTISYFADNVFLSNTASNFVQTLQVSGRVSPTKNWRVNYSTGYDFINKRLSTLSIDVARDLHCWQFTFSWMPIAPGGYQYFLFRLNAKSSMLQDLKIPDKRRDWYDRKI